MNPFRLGQHIYVPRIGNVSIAKFNDDETAQVNMLSRPSHSLRVRLDSALPLANTPVPLFWDKPVYDQNGVRWHPNDKGYGRTVETMPDDNLGRQMFYGWVNDDPNDHTQNGGWWYEDGTPARPGTPGNLTNVPPPVQVGDRVRYITPGRTEPGHLGWDGQVAKVVEVGRDGMAVIDFEDSKLGRGVASLPRLHLVERPAPPAQLLTVDDEIVAICDLSDDRVFQVLGTFTPRGSDWALIVGYIINNRELDDRQFIHVNPLTGRAVPRWSGDNYASNVRFKRKVQLRVYGDTLAASGTGVNVTEVDGAVTKVDLA